MCLKMREKSCIFAVKELQYRRKMNFLKEKYWNSMNDDVLTMSGDIVITY